MTQGNNELDLTYLQLKELAEKAMKARKYQDAEKYFYGVWTSIDKLPISEKDKSDMRAKTNYNRGIVALHQSQLRNAELYFTRAAKAEYPQDPEHVQNIQLGLCAACYQQGMAATDPILQRNYLRKAAEYMQDSTLVQKFKNTSLKSSSPDGLIIESKQKISQYLDEAFEEYRARLKKTAQMKQIRNITNNTMDSDEPRAKGMSEEQIKANALYNQGVEYMTNGNNVGAIAVFQAVSAMAHIDPILKIDALYNLGFTWYNQGAEYMKAGNHVKAEEAFEAANKVLRDIDPEVAQDARHYRDVSALQRVNAIQTNAQPSAQRSSWSAEEYQKGVAHMKDEKYAEAAKAFADAAQDKSMTQAFRDNAKKFQAAALYKQGIEHADHIITKNPNYAEAVDAFTRASQVDVNNLYQAYAAFYRGVQYMQDDTAEKYKDAAEAFEIAHSKATQVPALQKNALHNLHAALNNQGIRHMEAKEYAKAAEAFTKAGKVGDEFRAGADNNLYAALHNLGAQYINDGNSAKTSTDAAQAFEKAAEAFAKATEATKALTKINDAIFYQTGALHQQGVAHMKAQRYAEAIEAFEAASKATKDPNLKFNAQYNIGVAHMKARVYGEAAEAFEAAARVSGISSEFQDKAQYNIGIARMSNQEYAEAAEAFTKVSEAKDPELQKNALHHLCIAHMKSERYMEAVQALHITAEATEESIYSVYADFSQGMAHMKAKKYAEAAEAFEAASKATQAPALQKNALYNLHAALYNQGVKYIGKNHTAAVQAFTKVSETTKDPKLKYNALNSQGVAHMTAGKYEEAAEAFEAASKAVPDQALKNSANNNLGMARYNQGVAHMKAKKYAEAAEAFKKARAVTNNIVLKDDALRSMYSALNNQGVAHMKAQKYAEAAEAFEAASKAVPDQALKNSANNNLGMARYNQGVAHMKAKKYAEAAEAFEAASKATQAPALQKNALYNLHAALYNQGVQYIGKNHTAAVQAFTKVSETTNDPKLKYNALNSQGVAHMTAGKYAEAAEAFEAASKAAPDQALKHSANNNLGMARYNQGVQYMNMNGKMYYTNAAEAFEAASKAVPDQQDFDVATGTALLEAHTSSKPTLEQAKAAFKRANENHPDALIGLGIIAIHQGLREQATEYFKRAEQVLGTAISNPDNDSMRQIAYFNEILASLPQQKPNTITLARGKLSEEMYGTINTKIDSMQTGMKSTRVLFRYKKLTLRTDIPAPNSIDVQDAILHATEDRRDIKIIPETIPDLYAAAMPTMSAKNVIPEVQERNITAPQVLPIEGVILREKYPQHHIEPDVKTYGKISSNPQRSILNKETAIVRKLPIPLRTADSLEKPTQQNTQSVSRQGVPQTVYTNKYVLETVPEGFGMLQERHKAPEKQNAYQMQQNSITGNPNTLSISRSQSQMPKQGSTGSTMMNFKNTRQQAAQIQNSITGNPNTLSTSQSQSQIPQQGSTGSTMMNFKNTRQQAAQIQNSITGNPNTLSISRSQSQMPKQGSTGSTMMNFKNTRQQAAQIQNSITGNPNTLSTSQSQSQIPRQGSTGSHVMQVHNIISSARKEMDENEQVKAPQEQLQQQSSDTNFPKRKGGRRVLKSMNPGFR